MDPNNVARKDNVLNGEEEDNKKTICLYLPYAVRKASCGFEAAG